MKRMGYREALEFCAVEGQTLIESYDDPYASKPKTRAQIIEDAAGDTMIFTVAAIFGKDAQSVARAVIRRQEAAGRS